MQDLPVWLQVIAPIGALVALVVTPVTAWAGVKYGLNGARQDITDIKATQSEMKATQVRHGKDLVDARERLARIEGQLDR